MTLCWVTFFLSNVCCKLKNEIIALTSSRLENVLSEKKKIPKNTFVFSTLRSAHRVINCTFFERSELFLCLLKLKCLFAFE